MGEAAETNVHRKDAKTPKRIKAILVHGTFATNASWDDDPEDKISRDGGDPSNRKHMRELENKSTGVFVPALRAQLAEVANGAQLTTERFLWSGDNRHQARRAAAVALVDRLKRGFPTRYDPSEEAYTDERLVRPNGAAAPDDKEFDEIFVIGHSHGGTIARLAMGLVSENEAPTGVITFGSPFVRFKPRELDTVCNVLRWLVRVIAFLSLVLIVGLAMADALPFNEFFDDQAKTGAVYAVLVLLVGFLLDWGIKRVRDALRATQEMLHRDYDPTPTAKVGFLSYHAIFDEAGVWLRILSFITWVFQTIVVTTLNSAYFITFMVIFGMIYGGFAWFGYPSPEWTNRIFSPLVVSYREVAPFFGLQTQATLETFCVAKWLPGGVIISGFVTFVVLVALTMIAAPIALLLPTLLRSSGIGFGGEPFRWSLASEIDVDRTANPASELRVLFLPQAWLSGRLQHNYYYDAPKLHQEIAARMRHWSITPRQADWSVFERYPLWTLRALFQAGVILLMMSGAMFFSADLARDFDPIYQQTGAFCDPKQENAPTPFLQSE